MKQIYLIIFMSFAAIGGSMAAEGDASLWKLYINETSLTFYETATANVYKAEKVGVTNNTNFKVYYNNWSPQYGWTESHTGCVGSAGKAVECGYSSTGNGWLGIETGIYDVTLDISKYDNGSETGYVTIQFDHHTFYTTAEDGNVAFQIIGGNAIITKIYNKYDVTIPASVTPSDDTNKSYPVTAIGSDTWLEVVENKTDVTSITLPTSVTLLGNGALYGCKNITKVYCNAATAPTIYDGNFKYWDGENKDNRENIELYIPQGSRTSYSTSWTGFKSTDEFTNLYIGDTGYTTYYNSERALLLPAWFIGYTVTSADTGKLTLNPCYDDSGAGHNGSGTVVVPKGCAVLLKGWQGDFKVVLKDDGETFSGTNCLYGTDAAETPTNDDRCYYYKLGKGSNGLGWYWGASEGVAFENGAHKAYLKIPKAARARSFVSLFDGGTTSASETFSEKSNHYADAPIYNFNGQQIGHLRKGLYIVNGRKIVIK